MPSNNTIPLAIFSKIVFNSVMNKNPESKSNFPNLNLRFEDREDSMASYTLRAVDKVYKEIADAKEKAKEALENSLVDPLTGCFNQNYFEKKFKIENFNPLYDRNKIALVYIDLNGLKEINDTPEDKGGGHKVGDQQIKKTAKLLRSRFRGEDIVIRLHGDEFVVICRDRKDGINEEKLKISLNSPKFWQGKNRDDETKKKISETKKMRGISDKQKEILYRTVYKINVKTNEVQIYKSTKHASDVENVNQSTISRRCLKNKTVKDILWTYNQQS